MFAHIGQDQVQVNRATSDAIDARLEDIIYKMIGENYRNGETIVPYNGEVVPRTVSPENRGQIEDIVLNVAVALVSAIKIQLGMFRPLDMSKLDKTHDYQLELAFGDHNVRDVYHRPQRANSIITFTSKRRVSREERVESRNIVNAADNTATIAEVGGYLQPIWIPENTNRWSYNQDRKSQCFAAEFVITNVATPFATSPAAVAMAVSNFIALAEKDNWLAGFLPHASRRNMDEAKDITSVGGLNVLANLGGQDTGNSIFGPKMLFKEARFDLEQMHSYLTAIFHSGLVVSLDVPEQGPTSWYLEAYAAAANGDQQAELQIIAAFDEITGGRFSKLHRGNQLFSQSIRVPNGHYVDGGEERDIRTIDLTAVCNIFSKQPDMITRYHRAMIAASSAGAATVNLADLESIIQIATNHTAVFTGYSNRVTFADSVIVALSDAIADCRLPCTVQSPLSTDYNRFGVVVPSFVSSSLARVSRGYDSGRYNDRYADHRYGGRFGRY